MSGPNAPDLSAMSSNQHSGRADGWQSSSTVSAAPAGLNKERKCRTISVHRAQGTLLLDLPSRSISWFIVPGPFLLLIFRSWSVASLHKMSGIHPVYGLAISFLTKGTRRNDWFQGWAKKKSKMSLARLAIPNCNKALGEYQDHDQSTQKSIWINPHCAKIAQ